MRSFTSYFFASHFSGRPADKSATTAARLVAGLIGAAMLLFAPLAPSAVFDGMRDAIERGDFGNLKAVVISQHGDVLFEEYFRGSHADELHQVQSVTKSVGSALIGVAHRQGKIDLDQRLEHYFSGLYDLSGFEYRGKANITVEHILQQRHGIAWDEESTDYRNPANPVGRMVQTDDWYQFVLTRPMDASPGSKFSYSSGASLLMSRMVRVATGLSVEDFAMKALFEPLGIPDVHWELYSESGRGFGLTDWPAPDHDVPLAFALWLRARDMLKFGELFLNGGSYNGRRILDQSWVDASWKKYSHAGNSDYFSIPGWGHGYQWWVANVDDPLGRNWNVYFASGWGSQVIFILPELGLVVVTAADNYNHNGADVDVLLVTRVLAELRPVLDRRFDGAWYNRATSGQGVNLEIVDDGNRLVGFWYTYGANGSKRWFTLNGPVTGGTAEVSIVETSNGVFLNPSAIVRTEWGRGRFSVVDCDHVSFEVESIEVVTTIPLTRLTGVCFRTP